MTRIHHLGRYVLLALIVLHLMAVLMHWAIRRDNLVAPMLHGRKQAGGAEDVRPVSPWRALALAAVSAAAVWTVIVWGGSG